MTNRQAGTNAHLPSEVAEALARGALVLTANARAARALERAFAVEMQLHGRASWQAPAICDWSAWLEDLFRKLAERQDAGALPVLLGKMQEEHLWRWAQAEEATGVVSPEQLAALAAEAYALLSDYEAHAARRSGWAAAHEDAEHFLHWARTFDTECARLGVLPRAALAALLCEHAAQLQVPEELLLVGFDRLLPAQQHLLETLAQKGIRVARMPPADAAERQEVLYAADEQQEMYACAAWVRAQLEQEPLKRVAVLLPQAHGARGQLDRVFRRVLTPEAAMRPPAGAPLYEFSLGVSLADVPVVAAALMLLRWLAGPLPAAEVSNLLAGGFAASNEEESLALGAADAVLRRRGLLAAELDLNTLLTRAQSLLPPGFSARMLAAAVWSRRDSNRGRSYAEWAAAVEDLLLDCGWPGFAAESSIAFQARRRWSSLVAESATLGFRGGRISWAEFVRDLNGWARRTLFAAESRNAPVQILGIAEASGQSFDAVWVLQATEDRWPASGRVHPLLAPALQRDHGMPHASQQADLQLAQEQLRRVLGSAPLLVASYARQREGAELRPSPLLRHLSVATAQPVTAANPLSALARATEQVNEADTVRPWPANRVAGGSEVLKYQSACGFQGFAIKRLGASSLEEERRGPDARERGGLLHKALEQLYSAEPVPPDGDRLHTSEDLAHAIENGTLVDKARAAVARAIHTIEDTMQDDALADAWDQRYLALEQERLTTRVLWWLAEETKRAPFSVQALEQSVPGAAVGSLRLNLRVDRVDSLENGRKLVLDYKTGATVSTKQWMGERPEEPQLPIYALFGGLGDVAAVAFGQVRAAHTKLHCLQEESGAEEGDAKDSRTTRGAVLDTETRAAWERALTALADAYTRGEAPVNPRDGESTCERCGLYGVCRVRSQAHALLAIMKAEDRQDDAGQDG